MKHLPLAIVALLVAGALWFLFGTDERGPGARAVESPSVEDALSSAELSPATGESPGEDAELANGSRTPPVPTADEGVAAEAPPSPSAEDPWGTLELTVTDRATGKGLPGLWIEYKRLGSSADAQSGAGATSGAVDEDADPVRVMRVTRGRTPETDRDGRSVTTVRAGVALRLVVRAIGVDEDLLAQELEPLAPDQVRELAVEVDESLLPRFWVRILAAESGDPLPEASVLEVDAYGDLLHLDGPLDSRTWSSRPPLARPDPDGLVALTSSAMIQKRFAAVADGRGPVFFAQERSADTEPRAHVVELARAASLDALVVDARGTPVSGAELRLDADIRDLLGRPAERGGLLFGRHALHAETGAGGRARVEGLPAGATLRASLRAPGYGADWQVTAEPVLPLAPGEQRSQTFVARRSTDVYGIVRDQFGAPAAGVEMLLVRDEGAFGGYLPYSEWEEAKRTPTTDTGGRFASEDMPAGRWIVSPRPKRNPYANLAGASGENPQGLVLADLYAPVPVPFELTGEAGRFDLELSICRGLYVSGIVLGPDGELAGKGSVRAELGEKQGFTFFRLGPDGAFLLGPLPDLPVTLSAENWSGAKSEEVQVEPDATGVELVLYLGGTLSLSTRDAQSGEPVVCEFDAWRTDSGGLVVERRGYVPRDPEFEWEGLVPGTWSVFAQGPTGQFAFAEGLDVRAGETTGPVVLALEPGGTLRLERSAEGAAEEVRVEVYRTTGARARVGVARLGPGEAAELPVPSGVLEVVVGEEPDSARPPQLISVLAGDVVTVAVDG